MQKLTFTSTTRDRKVIYCETAIKTLIGDTFQWACLNDSMITWVSSQDWTLDSIEEA